MTVYILHFSEPISGKAGHYTGFADNVEARLRHHQNGTGARLTAVAVERGVQMTLARTFSGADRFFERKLKNTKNIRRYCPICMGKTPEYHPRNKGNSKDGGL
jgi:predicted GIY-YIG superfamily endonuclease